MSNKNFQTYFDCGFSKIRAGTFDCSGLNKAFFSESKFLSNHEDLNLEIQKIITSLEKNTNEYINEVNLMIDSPFMKSVGMTVSKNFDGSKLNQEDIQFLVQEAKQQILKYYKDKNIVHIIIDNYKIDDVEYTVLPSEILCNSISIDILFICLPKAIIEYFKSFFFKFNISVNEIICSSYAKSVNYKNNLSLDGNISFVDIGFNKTSITSFVKNKIVSLDALPIGGSHITKDISKVLKINLEQSENIKLNFDTSQNFLKDKSSSLDLLRKIIIARTEELLELSTKSIKLNLINSDQYKIVLIGDGSKIVDNTYVDMISFAKNIDFLDETTQDICNSGLRLGIRPNKQEVVVIPKKQTKQGFFEKLFLFLK
tara:strand:+ start:2523 stop:3632 length:1110 start_codon:yes stop_codon:yes gene_type:complete